MEHDCQKTAALLADYLGGKLTQGDRQRLDLILEDCGDCARALTEMEGNRQNAEHVPEADRLKAAKKPGQSALDRRCVGFCTSAMLSAPQSHIARNACYPKYPSSPFLNP